MFEWVGFKYGWRFGIGMLVGKPGQCLVSWALAINDRFPRNWVTGLMLWMALPLLNLRNCITGANRQDT